MPTCPVLGLGEGPLAAHFENGDDAAGAAVGFAHDVRDEMWSR